MNCPRCNQPVPRHHPIGEPWACNLCPDCFRREWANDANLSDGEDEVCLECGEYFRGPECDCVADD